MRGTESRGSAVHAIALQSMTQINVCAEAAEPPPEIKLPKAVLQQLCQKQQWPPPRFERLPPGGHRLAHAGMRYSVTLSMPASSGPRKKKVRQRSLPYLVPLESEFSVCAVFVTPANIRRGSLSFSDCAGILLGVNARLDLQWAAKSAIVTTILQQVLSHGTGVQAAPPKTLTVHEEDDGWETIQDAQNAAALFVLFSVSFHP